MGAPSFLTPLGFAGIAYLLAIREFFSTPRFPHRVIVIGLVLAALWHLPFLLTPPGSDDDIHRYLWDGRVQRLGYNPYVVVPSDPALAGVHTPETRTLNNPDLSSPYPTGAQLFFRAVTAIHESVFALKVAFVVCDFAIVFVLLDILRRSGQGAHWVLAYAWNPLLAVEVAGSGHIDIVGALLLLVSVAALERRWRAVAALAFGLAVAVKLLPIVLLPLYWRRVRVRDGALVRDRDERAGSGAWACSSATTIRKSRRFGKNSKTLKPIAGCGTNNRTEPAARLPGQYCSACLCLMESEVCDGTPLVPG